MKIAVIGAGVAGLCSALRLAEARTDSISEIAVLEKTRQAGGLLQSTIKDGYWWDNGAFKFGSTNFLVKLLPDVFEEFDGYLRKVWYSGKLHPFPFNLKSLMLSQSVTAMAATALDYASANIKCRLGPGAYSLNDWLRYRIPSRLLKQSQLETYISKLQGQTTHEISPIFGEQRLKYLDRMTRPGKLLKTIFSASRNSRKGQGVTLVYPSGPGVGTISRRLAELCEARGIKIHYGVEVKQLVDKGAAGLEICYEGKEGPDAYQADFAITTIPLDELVAVCRSQVSDECAAAAAMLRFMDLQLAFFTVRRPHIIDPYLTLYSFEKHHKWKRLVARSLPGDLSSVLVEITFDPRHGDPPDDLIEQVQRELTDELRLFETNEIVTRHTATVRKAYPVYDIGFEKRVNGIIQELESKRLRTAGRQGRFLYTSTPGVIQTALDAADAILLVIPNA